MSFKSFGAPRKCLDKGKKSDKADGFGDLEEAKDSNGTEEETPEPIVISGTEGDDQIKIQQQKNGTVIVDVNGEKQTFSKEDAERLLFELGEGNNTLDAQGMRDAINVIAGNGNNTILGGRGNDNITAGNGNNVIVDDKGNDTVNVGNGNNIISTGSGRDTINAGSGNNVISGGKGGDSITTGTDNNIIKSDGKDTIATAKQGDSKISPLEAKDIPTQGMGGDHNSVSPELEQYYAARGEEIVYEDHPPFGVIPLVDRGIDIYGDPVRINANMGPDFDRMMIAAAEAGHTIEITSSYRTAEQQNALHRRMPDLALPAGHSESNHEQGMALDFNSGAGRDWLTEHAAEFNFLSFADAYPNVNYDEEWHFNYNGNQPQAQE